MHRQSIPFEMVDLCNDDRIEPTKLWRSPMPRSLESLDCRSFVGKYGEIESEKIIQEAGCRSFS